MFKACLVSIICVSQIPLISAILYDDVPNNICIGKHGMPYRHKQILLVKKFQPFVFNNFDKLPIETTIENDNHNLVVNMKYDEVPTVEMGPLEGIGTFKFDSIYFNFIENLHAAYAVQYTPFPAELHLLFYNSKYEHLVQAIDHRNSIAVLAFVFVGDHDLIENTDFDSLQQNLKYVQTPYTKTSIDNRALKDWILSEDIIQRLEFYSYNGSLVRYACGNDVIWIDFMMPISVELELIHEFRQLQTSDHKALMDQYEVYPQPQGYVLRNYNPEVHRELVNWSLLVPESDAEETVDYLLDNKGHLNVLSKVKFGALLFVFVIFLNLY